MAVWGLPAGALSEQLDTYGFAVVDNAFGKEFCEAMRKEIDALERNGHLSIGKNILSNAEGEGVVMERPNIFERDLVLEETPTPDGILDESQTLNDFFWERGVEFAQTIGAAFPRAKLKCIDTIKVQKNTGDGGCFPLHFDTSTATSKREITCVLYLNPEWDESHGGQLRVYPFPYERTDLAPLNDRLIIFSSHQLLHRVMPSLRPRYVLSMWLARGDGEPVSFPIRPVATAQLPIDDQRILAFLYRPANRRVLSKLLYASDWAQSVREAFGESPVVDAALEVHWADVAKLQASVNAPLWELLQQCLPLSLPPLPRPYGVEDP